MAEGDGVPNPNQCDLCSRIFRNGYQLGPHKKKCWRLHSQVFSNSEFSDSVTEEEFCVTEEEFCVPEDAHATPATEDPRDAGKGLWTLARRSDEYVRKQPWVAPNTCQYHRHEMAQDFLPVKTSLSSFTHFNLAHSVLNVELCAADAESMEKIYQ